MNAFRLITIGVSHYCEKARWALQKLGFSFVEEPHLPVVHILHARWHTGDRTVPVLITPDGVFDDSTDILQYLDEKTQPESGLYPTDPEKREEVEALEDRFDETLGPAARRLAYFHALKYPSLTRPILAGDAGLLTRTSLFFTFPLLRAIMRKAMRIDADGADRSRTRIQTVFDEVEELLADDRPYLTGDSFTAADLTFAALAAPVIFPPEYGHPMPPLEETPDPMRDEVESLRERPAGRFVLKMYETERN